MRRRTMCNETPESLVCEYDYETLARSPTGNHILLSPFLSGGIMLQLLLHRRCTARTSDPTSLETFSSRDVDVNVERKRSLPYVA